MGRNIGKTPAGERKASKVFDKDIHTPPVAPHPIQWHSAMVVVTSAVMAVTSFVLAAGLIWLATALSAW
jgi:hypothetical protein